MQLLLMNSKEAMRVDVCRLQTEGVHKSNSMSAF